MRPFHRASPPPPMAARRIRGHQGEKQGRQREERRHRRRLLIEPQRRPVREGHYQPRHEPDEHRPCLPGPKSHHDGNGRRQVEDGHAGDRCRQPPCRVPELGERRARHHAPDFARRSYERMLRTPPEKPSQMAPPRFMFAASAQSSMMRPRMASTPPAAARPDRRASMQPPAAAASGRRRSLTH